MKGKDDMDKMEKSLQGCNENNTTKLNDKTTVVKCKNGNSFSITKGLK